MNTSSASALCVQTMQTAHEPSDRELIDHLRQSTREVKEMIASSSHVLQVTLTMLERASAMASPLIGS